MPLNPKAASHSPESMASEDEKDAAEQQMDASRSETGSVSSSESIPVLVSGRDYRSEKFTQAR